MKRKPFPVVGIGASAGGLDALRDLLKALPPHTGMAFIIVQHLDPSHASLLAPLLAKSATIPVEEVHDRLRIEPDHCYVIPPNTEMQLTDGKLRLRPRPRGQRAHRPIDIFFSSLASERQSQAIGVILSGASTDGVSGLGAIKEAGGFSFAQDPKTAQFPEMPQQARDAGYVDLVLPPAEIARELSRIRTHPYVAAPQVEPPPSTDATALTRILEVLRKAFQVDFTLYKSATIHRRIERRMALHRFDSIGEYARHVQDHPEEAEALYDDVLIKVTEFFRDPPVFEALGKTVIPAILKNREGDAPVRIWVPGCSTGEEAYSIAMLLLEARFHVPCQIFSTDVSEAAIEKARAGIYGETVMAGVSPERTRRFFARINGKFQIQKRIREMCIFARQDLTRDPAFSRLDLISCRNVLIYLEPAAQKRLLPLFHYALKPGGYLLLGSSESITSYASLFLPFDKKRRIYVRKATSTPPTFELPVGQLPKREAESRASTAARTAPATEGELQREIDRYIVQRFAPPGVVVNEDFEILQFRGQTADYLRPASGKASLNLLRMAREGLLHDLRAALQKARKKKEAVRTRPIALGPDHPTGAAVIDVIPLGRQCLVLFQEHPTDARRPEMPKIKPAKLDLQVRQLRQELVASREHLQSIIEEQEATNEELKSANEEVLSSNEELQSLNEELETAKEELQSTNEELMTLNEELQNRNSELGTVNNDMLNLLASVNLPILMVGNDLRIRRFTPASEKMFNLIAADVGRPVTDVKPAFDLKELGQTILESIENVSSVEREVRDAQGRWHLLRVRPYRTRDHRIDGAVVILLDIDEKKRLGEAAAVGDALTEHVRELVVLVERDGIIRRASTSFQMTFGDARRLRDVGLEPLLPIVEKLLAGSNEFSTESEANVKNRVFEVRGRRIDPSVVLLVLDERN